MATYRGSKRIADVLDAGSVDRQLQRLEQFDNYYSEVMSGAVKGAVDLAGDQASKNAPNKQGNSSGELKASIFKKFLGVNKSNMQVRGAIGIDKSQGIKGIIQEVGRYYGQKRWKGFFYLYYGAMDKKDEIRELYAKANEEIVGRLVTQ